MPPLSKNEKISNEAVYSELYNEMRRYRDYELSASTWYTAILIALLGFIVSVKYGSSDPVSTFSHIWYFQVLVLLISTILGVSSFYSIWYANKRYSEIRKIVDEHLEPKWVKEAFKPILLQKRVRPRRFIYIIQILLVVVTWVISFLPRN
jgi:hypothetical protein